MLSLGRLFKSGFLLAMLGPLTAFCDTTVYSTGFENPPFTVGDINGQGGWQVYSDYAGSADISTVLPQTGSQSLFLNGASGGVQSGAYHSDVAVGPIVELSASLAIFSGTSQSEFQFAALGAGLIGFLGGIDIFPDNSIHAITAGFTDIGTWARGTTFDASAYHQVSLIFDITTQTYSVAIDGATIGSNIPFCGGNTSCPGTTLTYGNGIFDSLGNGTTNTDSAYMDNYSVTDITGVPEPSTAIPVLAALLSCASLAVLRRRKTS